MQEKIYQKGTFILESDKMCEELIFIVNGMVEVLLKDANGDFHCIEELY